MTAQQTTLRAFIAKHKIRMSCEWADSNPNMDQDDWHRSATHWRCTLKCGRRTMTVYFSQGSAHTKDPTAEDVLDCLASDAASVDNARSFDDWCGDLGYDTDSRKAERTYQACEKQGAKLKALLGDEAYETLLYHTERL